MTVSVLQTQVIYTGNSSTTQWDIPFPFLSKDDLEIYVIDSYGNKTLVNEDFSVDEVSKKLTYPLQTNGAAPLGSDKKLLIMRLTPLLQQTSFAAQETLDPSVLEKGYDKAMLIAQELAAKIDHCIQLPQNTDSNTTDLNTYLEQVEQNIALARAAAASAQSSAQSALSGQETVQAAVAEVQSALVSVQTASAEMQTATQTALSGKADTDLSNVTIAGTSAVQTALDGKMDKDWINSPYITNCLTQIAQDIELQISAGALTLKAGSKVYVPNGSGVFDTYTMAADIGFNNTSLSSMTGMVFLSGCNTDTATLNIVNVTQVSSGTSTPSTGWYYNTSANMIYKDGTAGSIALPLGLVEYTNGSGVVRVKQVFNGIGYIGSVLFALPGIKGLLPNGRNADGTLHNTVLQTTAVTTRDGIDGTYGRYVYLNNTAIDAGVCYRRYIQDVAPAIGNSFERWYNPAENRWYYHEAGGTTWTAVTGGLLCAGRVITNSGNVSDLSVYPVKSVENSAEMASSGMPGSRYVNLTLGSSGSTYTMPADGWLYIDKQAGSANAYMVFSNSDDSISGEYATAMPATGSHCCLLMPVRAGARVTVTYNASGTTHYFRFIYAQGAK